MVGPGPSERWYCSLITPSARRADRRAAVAEHGRSMGSGPDGGTGGGVAAVAQRDEQVTQLGTLLGGEAGEDGVLGLALSLGGVLQPALALPREADDVAAPVGGVTVALDVAVPFERVEQ